MGKQAWGGLKALRRCAGSQREVEKRHNDPSYALEHKGSLVGASF